MGLDMYLIAERYIGYTDKAKNAELRPVADSLLPPGDNDRAAITISRHCAYWRKANQIHSWFVNNVQDGIDDCREYSVDTDKLRELRDTCVKVRDGTKMKKAKVVNGYTFVGGKQKPIMEDGEVMENPELAKELLPCVEGFSFGSTDYNNWYMRDIVDTIEQIDKILAWVEAEQALTGKSYSQVDFRYRASW